MEIKRPEGSLMVALFWFTIRQYLRARQLWLVALLMAGPCALALLVRRFEPPGGLTEIWEAYHEVMLSLLFMIVLPLMCMLYGSTLIGSEVEARTVVYLVTRRMRRATVLLVRFTATALLLVALFGIAVLAFHLCMVGGADIEGLNSAAGLALDRAWQPGRDLAAYLSVIPLGVVAFLAVFTLISLVTPRSLTISALYIVIVEAVVACLPVRAQVYTITHQLRQSLTTFISRDLLHVVGPPGEFQERLYPIGETGTFPLLMMVFVVMGLACILVSKRELAPSRVVRG